MTSPIDLPISIINDIIKSNIDSDILLSKNTKLAFSRIGGVFIMYISHLAFENAKKKKRVKITEKDIKEALILAGFEDFIDKLDEFMRIYENENEKQGGNNDNQAIEDNLYNSPDEEMEVDNNEEEEEEEMNNNKNNNKNKNRKKNKESEDYDQVKEIKNNK